MNKSFSLVYDCGEIKDLTETRYKILNLMKIKQMMLKVAVLRDRFRLGDLRYMMSPGRNCSCLLYTSDAADD